MSAETELSDIEKALKAMELEHEGLRDLGKLVTNDEARVAVGAKLEDYDRRSRLLVEAHHALTALILDGYPRLDASEVVGLAYDDIKNQIDSTTAALGKFTSGQATKLNVKVGEPVKK